MITLAGNGDSSVSVFISNRASNVFIMVNILKLF